MSNTSLLRTVYSISPIVLALASAALYINASGYRKRSREENVDETGHRHKRIRLNPSYFGFGNGVRGLKLLASMAQTQETTRISVRDLLLRTNPVPLVNDHSAVNVTLETESHDRVDAAQENILLLDNKPHWTSNLDEINQHLGFELEVDCLVIVEDQEDDTYEDETARVLAINEEEMTCDLEFEDRIEYAVSWYYLVGIIPQCNDIPPPMLSNRPWWEYYWWMEGLDFMWMNKQDVDAPANTGKMRNCLVDAIVKSSHFLGITIDSDDLYDTIIRPVPADKHPKITSNATLKALDDYGIQIARVGGIRNKLDLLDREEGVYIVTVVLWLNKCDSDVPAVGHAIPYIVAKKEALGGGRTRSRSTATTVMERILHNNWANSKAMVIEDKDLASVWAANRAFSEFLKPALHSVLTGVFQVAKKGSPCFSQPQAPGGKVYDYHIAKQKQTHKSKRNKVNKRTKVAYGHGNCRECPSCKVIKLFSDYSKSQWHKGAKVGKCKECVHGKCKECVH